MTGTIEFGLNTFGDATNDLDGTPRSHAQVIRDVVEEGVLAEQVGIDAFAVGEHHRDDFAISTPETVLAAIAARTERIRLGSAVTVLSSDDPVRVFQRFSTVDAISSGRAEVMLGRGSFTESFPLFGLNLQDYEVLFDEKLDLFMKIAAGGPVSWSGTVRGALNDVTVHPQLEEGRLRTWAAVGGTPQSVVRAAQYSMPLMLAIIGGESARFAPFAKLYRQANEQFGHPNGPIGAHSPGHIADTDEQAREEHWLNYRTMMMRIGKERGWSPMQYAQYEQEAGERGALYVGSPETVARKIAATVKVLGLQRFDLKYSAGTLPHEHSMKAIELYGTKVIPMVRDLLA
ncbi:LLM class flavin-dependent oxidoreductase [Pseudoclavibacter sp. RFBJ3]|uniref:LLM class flavin-dependent oxidoreductase n=1 Tax=unclassified Pseudoclavibacter TaxID=2615177 RepID=UPI000CE740FD|nr:MULTISPECIES: LLM class flavin-dependent oxidoreductase [unclassified Pseudoclavibacter]PPF74705.1 LLM class flavin-dependent oxidoreductase [Pseudoclavibacter sp. Z016]PPF82902.1 LLM class flavin-dependent oxidoreductase [Pseudoclavibacter sp. RFBJ5]PPF91633.1 LLM class flavin-dependent oxidoreductase [Pseudoclavibacter sp. RFBJ3]PPF97519.1 LLM class flavin-dependent oxidoreductase [Pseudoclavibacter sp. RFBH5]PPG22412.1 LLM class flavin-dependent oxidoreductase [Pseudoclavibacter sp. RFBI